MPELGSYGSVRGARGNSRPYREPGTEADMNRQARVANDLACVKTQKFGRSRE